MGEKITEIRYLGSQEDHSANPPEVSKVKERSDFAFARTGWVAIQDRVDLALRCDKWRTDGQLVRCDFRERRSAHRQSVPAMQSSCRR